MKRKMNEKTYTTTREVYKEAKRYDHGQFDRFCTGIYIKGFQDGAENIPGADLNDVMAKIEGIKGIGSVRLQKIRESIEELFQAQEGKEEGETE